MKITVAQLAFLGLLPLATAGHGSELLAEQKQCLQCHQVAKAFAGPSFQEIAQKYKGKAGALDSISAIVRQGSRSTGGPHWGKATMPDTAERPEVSAAEARQLAGWILQQ